MALAVRLTIEQPKRLATNEEAEVLRAALVREPGALPLRRRLAALCIELDAFDEAIALLEPVDPSTLDTDSLLRLARACFERAEHGDAARADALAAIAEARATTAATRAVAIAERAKAASRQGRDADAIALLETALDIDPMCRPAMKRLFRHLMAADRPDGLLALTDRLRSAGARQTRVLASRTCALARLGRIDAARAGSGVDRIRCTRIDAPPGWRDLAAFNAQLADELLANPGLRYNRKGVASQSTWRVDTPQRGDVPAVAALVEALVREVDSYVRTAEGSDDWAMMRPDHAELQCWAVHPEPGGYERWHMHPGGWISGGYYVDMPESVVTGADSAGCIAFGLSPTLVGQEAAAAFGERLVRPEPGSLILFPSHVFHRTYPHRSDGRRICLAFDIVPV